VGVGVEEVDDEDAEGVGSAFEGAGGVEEGIFIPDIVEVVEVSSSQSSG
jgi:hypothetical protein